jgi:hypothetical protein
VDAVLTPLAPVFDLGADAWEARNWAEEPAQHQLEEL